MGNQQSRMEKRWPCHRMRPCHRPCRFLFLFPCPRASFFCLEIARDKSKNTPMEIRTDKAACGDLVWTLSILFPMGNRQGRWQCYQRFYRMGKVQTLSGLCPSYLKLAPHAALSGLRPFHFPRFWTLSILTRSRAPMGNYVF